MSAFFCAQLARSENDQLFGTTKQIRLFIALEYWQPWNSKALQSELLPPRVRQFLGSVRQQVPQSRLLLIRQRDSKDRKPSCFVAIPSGPSSILYHQELDSYEDVLSLPILHCSPSLPKWTKPLFLVCNHGKHDKCCAKFGGAVLNADATSDAVWESSHLGGCRFAANMLCLPRGLMFGNLSPGDAARVMREYNAGNLDLDNLRGRSDYSKSAQAAEYFVRRQYGIQGIDRLKLLGSHDEGNIATTLFEDGSQVYEVRHTVTKSETPRILACADTEPEFVWSNHLAAISSHSK